MAAIRHSFSRSLGFQLIDDVVVVTRSSA